MSTLSTLDEVLSVKELAAILGRHPKTVLGYLHDGLIVGRLIRGRWYIRRSALEAFLGGERHEADKAS